MLLFFNISGGELVVIMLVAVMFFGKKGIPNVARTLGKGIRQFRDATQDIQRDILSSTEEVRNEVKKHRSEIEDNIKSKQS